MNPTLQATAARSPWGFRLEGTDTAPAAMLLVVGENLVLVRAGWDDPLNAGPRVHLLDGARIQSAGPGLWTHKGLQLRNLDVVRETSDRAALAALKQQKLWPVSPERRAAALDFAQREFNL